MTPQSGTTNGMTDRAAGGLQRPRKVFRMADLSQALGFFCLILCILFALFFLGTLIYFITARGISVISWEFLTEVPRRAMTKGGVAPAIVGTFYLTVGAMSFALPLGLACAIYLCEYSPAGSIVNIIRLSINNLAGVPSVVFGLFGFAVFVKVFGFGVSILSGSLTLGIMGMLTPYATGPSPVYYGSGYLPAKDFWILGGVFGVIFIAAFLLVGLPWMAMIR